MVLRKFTNPRAKNFSSWLNRTYLDIWFHLYQLFWFSHLLDIEIYVNLKQSMYLYLTVMYGVSVVTYFTSQNQCFCLFSNFYAYCGACKRFFECIKNIYLKINSSDNPYYHVKHVQILQKLKFLLKEHLELREKN